MRSLPSAERTKTLELVGIPATVDERVACELPFSTPPELAARWRMDVHRVLSLIRSGELRAYNLASRGSSRPRYRIHAADAEAFLASRLVVPPPPAAPRRRQRAREFAEWV